MAVWDVCVEITGEKPGPDPSGRHDETNPMAVWGRTIEITGQKGV
jgi:hypothetical protein